MKKNWPVTMLAHVEPSNLTVLNTHCKHGCVHTNHVSLHPRYTLWQTYLCKGILKCNTFTYNCQIINTCRVKLLVNTTESFVLHTTYQNLHVCVDNEIIGAGSIGLWIIPGWISSDRFNGCFQGCGIGLWDHEYQGFNLGSYSVLGSSLIY